MSFFTEWDFYFIPKTDYNPKWMNYKYKNKKLYDNQCISPKAQTSDKQWCNAHKVMAGIYNCSDCDDKGWSLWGNKCWRLKSGCWDSGTYSYNGLCYNENSACKPEMITKPDDFHCKSDWNIRDLNYYELSDTGTCNCTGSCYWGVKNVSTYDKTIFDVLGGISTNNIIKSVSLISQDKDSIYCNKLSKAFRVRVQLTKIKSWDVLDKLKNLFKDILDPIHTDLHYLNSIGYMIVEFYLMMNVAYDTQAVDYDTKVGMDRFSSYVPFFIYCNKSTDPAITSSTRSQYTAQYSLDFVTKNLEVKTLNRDYVTLSGAVPQSNILNGSQGIFLVKPTQFCYNTQKNIQPTYIETNPIIYLVFYDMLNIGNQERNLLKELKDKYINNASIASSPCRVWNSYVYYNHVLPNICYDTEDNSSYCNKIMNYDASPPSLVAQKCSLLTSNRFPDCKTYLVTDIEREQPKVNPVRTYSKLDTLQKKYCTKYDTLECQCHNRSSKSSYQLFQNTSGLLINSTGNDGCWYTPCLDDPTSNILIEERMREDKRNCPPTVCQNIISVINRPENSVNLSNLDLRTSCYMLSTATPKPKSPTTTPLPEEIIPTEQNNSTDGENSSSPPDETEIVSSSSSEETSNIIPEEDVQLSYTKIYIETILYVILLIIFVSYFIIYWIKLEKYGVGAILLIVSLLLSISVLLFFLAQNIRLIFTISGAD